MWRHFARLEKSPSQHSCVGPMKKATPMARARKMAINCYKFNDTSGWDGCSCLSRLSEITTPESTLLLQLTQPMFKVRFHTTNRATLWWVGPRCVCILRTAWSTYFPVSCCSTDGDDMPGETQQSTRKDEEEEEEDCSPVNMDINNAECKQIKVVFNEEGNA